MQPSRSQSPRKGPKFLDVKLLIAAIALAVTLGLWNLLSSNAAQVDTAAQVAAAPPPTTTDIPQDLPPLPTLVALMPISSLQASKSAPAPQADAASPTAELRVVTASTQAIVQKFTPVIDQPASVASSGSKGGGGGSSKPKAKSHSS
jgi:hypothetical protein